MLRTPQIFKTGTSLLDELQYHTQNTYFWGVFPLWRGLNQRNLSLSYKVDIYIKFIFNYQYYRAKYI